MTPESPLKKALPSILVAVVVGGAAAAAITRSDSSASNGRSSRATESAPPIDESQPLPTGHPSIPPLSEVQGQPLPPNHPPLTGDLGQGAGPSEEPEAASVIWKVPSAWKQAANPSSMRLATYQVPHGGAGNVDGELAISRAGGDVDANIARWAGQFSGGAEPKRFEKTVHGIKIAIVELDGTFSGGMGMSAGSHEGWGMLGAIVQAPGQPYFFKLTGPAAVVRNARSGFDALLDSVAPPTF